MTFLSAIGYARREASTRSLRSIEYDLLVQVTQQLRKAWAERGEDFPALVRAVTDNTQLWSTFAADIVLPENRLPAGLRARLFYLYEFAAHHGRKVLDEEASVEVLTDINVAVMRGLRGEGSAAT